MSLQIGCALASGNVEPVQRRDVSSLYAAALGDIRIDFSLRGNVVTVQGSLSSPVSLKRLLEDPYGAAEAFFREHGGAFGVQESTTFVPDRTKMPDELMVDFLQTHAGVRIEDSWAVVSYAQDGTVKRATLVFDTDIQIESVKPKIDEARARALALRHVKSRRRVFDDARVRGENPWEKPPELVIFPVERDWLLSRRLKSDLLAWVMEIESAGEVFVAILDANSGRLVNIKDSPYRFQINRMTFNLKDYAEEELPSVDWGDPDMDESGPLTSDADAEVRSLHEQVKESYDYFKTNFKWKSFDGADRVPLRSGAHYFRVRLLDPLGRRRTGANAHYYHRGEFGTEVIAFSTGMVATDVVTHEYAHAVTHRHGLTSSERVRGATRESFSDIFAAFHDDANWTIGEGAPSYPEKHMRDLSDPPSLVSKLTNRPFPDHIYKDNSNRYFCTSNPTAGIAHNSTILSHAAYNLATEIGPKGRQQAGQIYFKALKCLQRPRKPPEAPIRGFASTRDCVIQEAEPYRAADAARRAFEDIGMSDDTGDPECEGQCAVTTVVEGVYEPEDAIVVQGFGLEADKLRDFVFSESDLGNHYRTLFYEQSPNISAVLLASPGLFAETVELMSVGLPILQELTALEPESEDTVTQELIDQVTAYLNGLAGADQSTGRALGLAIESEMERIPWTELDGLTYVAAWQYLVDNVDLE